MAIKGHSGGPGVWPQVAGAPTSKDPKKLEKSKHKYMFDEKHHLCSGGNESLEVGRMLIAAYWSEPGLGQGGTGGSLQTQTC